MQGGGSGARHRPGPAQDPSKSGHLRALPQKFAMLRAESHSQTSGRGPSGDPSWRGLKKMPGCEVELTVQEVWDLDVLFPQLRPTEVKR